MRRVCVVGNSGSGKSHLARRLAARLGVPYVELDALNHRPGWTEAPLEEFQAELAERLAQSPLGWVVDGNYRSRVGDVLQPDTYVWLDYPRRVVFPRVVRRTLERLVLRRELWNGNRERWRNVVSRDPHLNILLWSWTQHDAYREKYEAMLTDEWVRLRSPRETERWLERLTA